MENHFVSLKKALEAKKLENPRPKFKSQRAELLNELYGHYEKSYKQNTWNEYCKWLKKNKIKHSKENVANFKKDKSFRKKITVKSFCSYWVSFLDKNDLYYLISIAKDKERRGENFNKWLFYSLKSKDVV